MRLIATVPSEDDAKEIAYFLEKKGISLIVEANSSSSFDIWITSEDEIERAKEYVAEFQKRRPTQKPSLKTTGGGLLRKQRGSLATKCWIALATIIYILTLYQIAIDPKKEVGHMTIKTASGSSVAIPFFTPIQLFFIYDCPLALSLSDTFLEKYGPLKEKEAIPLEGQAIIQSIGQHLPWPGFYQKCIEWREKEKPFRSEMFVSLRKGEVWRLFTPILLHANLIHILFNMIWLFMLGKAMERNMRPIGYLLFILGTAVITNTLQYLMTGPFFMGFSGVISAMGGYIWVRKKVAPWEVYLVEDNTLIFLGIFVLLMCAIQIVAFFLEILHIVSLPLQIANTAHISGLGLGMLFAKCHK